MAAEFTQEELAAEEWRPVPGFDGTEASSLGRVRSWFDYRFKPPKRLDVPRECPWTSAYPYPRVSFAGRHVYVHRLVMLAFVGERPRGMHTCHWDGSPTNNRRENLRYASPSENAADAARHGTLACGDRSGPRRKPERFPRGSKKHNAVLTEDIVVRMRHECVAGMSFAAVGRRYGIGPQHARNICTGAEWKHAGGPLVTESRRKLTADAVREIRRLSESGISQRKIAVACGCSQRLVLFVLQGKVWSHVA